MERKHAEYNIHNYVQDINESFDVEPFNEVDGLVLTQISNMNLSASGIDMYSGRKKTFAEIYKEMITKGTPMHKAYNSMNSDNKKLLEELANSDRYKNLIVSNYVNNPITGEKTPVTGFSSVGEDSYMEQFAAVTITYKQNGDTYNYVSYQATNDTTDGWTEDFAMLSRNGTQAQVDSLNYMNIIGETTEGYIIGGGHSKGGNDFEYAYLFCKNEVRDRIVKAYVYDSPGLESRIVEDNYYFDRYQEIIDGSFICPQDAIIGMLLHENENPSFVYSVESGFNQHDPYSWEIDPVKKTFVQAEQSELSKQINKALDRAVEGMSQEERDAVFTFIEYVMYNNGGESLGGLENLFAKGWDKPKDKIEEIWDVLSGSWNNMTKEEQDEFIDSLGVVFSALAFTGGEYAEENIQEWIDKKIKEFQETMANLWEGTVNWIEQNKQQFKKFIDNIYKSFVKNINKISAFLKKVSPGYKYSSYNPKIKIDTYKLITYAQRLETVNKRITNLDKRLDSLYLKIGLLDIWNLLQADLLTGYSWRIRQCANYLSDTATDFENVEKDLNIKLQ